MHNNNDLGAPNPAKWRREFPRVGDGGNNNGSDELAAQLGTTIIQFMIWGRSISRLNGRCIHGGGGGGNNMVMEEAITTVLVEVMEEAASRSASR